MLARPLKLLLKVDSAIRFIDGYSIVQIREAVKTLMNTETTRSNGWT